MCYVSYFRDYKEDDWVTGSRYSPCFTVMVESPRGGLKYLRLIVASFTSVLICYIALCNVVSEEIQLLGTFDNSYLQAMYSETGSGQVIMV